MGFSRFHSAAFSGLDSLHIEVEVDTRSAEESSLVIVGLPDTSVRESKDRVLAAINNSRLKLDTMRTTVNLAPGTLRKEGPLYDLPIALGLLKSSSLLDSSLNPDEYMVVGELSLSGHLRPIHGALAIAMLARDQGKKGLILPEANAKEAAAVPDLSIYPVSHLNDAIKLFCSSTTATPFKLSLDQSLFRQTPPPIDFSDVKGQLHVKRALEIAAAGHHNILLSGPPGSGKTMLARALIGIMPQLSVEEALESTKIHSIAGLLKSEGLITQRPFRAPHHTISYAGLIGGGTYPRPGEVSLAHNGILFLDEFPEFSRSVLEVLRQPLEDRQVTISRANGNFTFPTSFVCVSAMNPCPCGNLSHPDKACRCTQLQIDRYKSKISGPLKDRIDMHIEVPTLRYSDMHQTPESENSAVVQERVTAAREVQKERLGGTRSNGLMTKREMKAHCSLSSKGHETLQYAVDQLGMSARACDRILRVARTIADLCGEEKISHDHVMEAVSYRDLAEA